MITTLLKLMSSSKIYENLKHEEDEEISKHYLNEFEEFKQSFKEEDKEQISELILKHFDYIDSVQRIETDNYVILALKIGIELGRYFAVLEDL